MKIVEEHVELINDNVEEFDKAIELFKQGSPEQDFKDIELPQQERKETLEEAAKRLFPNEMEEYDIFLIGARWQMERSYNEEDMEIAFGTMSTNWICFDEFIEQFKKK